MGLRLILMLLTAYAEWAKNILVNGLDVPEIVLLNDSRIFPRVTQLTHIGPLNALSTEGKVL